MDTYTIRTEAVTRSKSRRSMVHIITASSEDEAIFQARMAHVRRCGWNTTIWIESVSVKA